MQERLVIVGGGFAGVWAALGAAKQRHRHRPRAQGVAITLVSRDRFLTIRPRLYEASLDGVRVPLDDVLVPAGVERVEGQVTRIDPAAHVLELERADGPRTLRYDALIVAAGSRVQRATVPGIEHAFSVDTYAEAAALEQHLAALPVRTDLPDDARLRAVVVGAGFTGVEAATELVTRLRALAPEQGGSDRARVVLVERAPHVAPDLGPGARRHVEQALAQLGIEARVGRAVRAVEQGGVLLSDGERIEAATTVWTGGFRASALAEQLSVERDEAGRLPVDAYLRVRGLAHVYAAGDVARAMADRAHVAPMSCQHAIPMGQRAGSNALSELLGAKLTPYAQPDYVTCLDLGAAGALFMQGWEREVRLTGFWAKVMKQAINTRLIYPPRAASASADALRARPAA